jgi:hypothetical protein
MENTPENPDEHMQFEQAEYAAADAAQASSTCTLCKLPIADTYYETGGKILCAGCRDRVEAAYRGGSPFGRASKALAFGTAAAAAGAVLYYLIIRMTGYNIGLVAIVVGFMVGRGVRTGSGNRGGRFYQFLALFLTYCAISAMHIPYILEAFGNAQKNDEQAAPTVSVKKAVARAKARKKREVQPAAPVEPSEPKEAPAPKAGATADAPEPKGGKVSEPQGAPAPKSGAIADGPAPKGGEPSEPEGGPAPDSGAIADGPAPKGEGALAKKRAFTFGRRREGQGPRQTAIALAVFLIVMFVVTFLSPIVLAFQAPISGLIFGFALWEAWRINRGGTLVFNGPFRVGTKGPIVETPEVAGDGG